MSVFIYYFYTLVCNHLNVSTHPAEERQKHEFTSNQLLLAGPSSSPLPGSDPHRSSHGRGGWLRNILAQLCRIADPPTAKQ